MRPAVPGALRISARAYGWLLCANGTDFEPCFELPLGPRSEWTLRGRTPVEALRFEHRERVTYVTRESLERSLARAAA